MSVHSIFKQGLLFLSISLSVSGCLNAMLADANKENYLKILAEQAGPILQLETNLKSGKKMSLTEAKTAVDQVQTCLSGMPDLMKAGTEEIGKPYLAVADTIPVASGPITVGAYYKKCQSLAKKFAKMEFEGCEQRVLELRATGSYGSFGDLAVYSNDLQCKASRPCYEAVVQKPEYFQIAECEEGAAENIPGDFKAHERKIRKACGNAMAVFMDEGLQLEKHNYDKKLDVKFARFKCYKEKTKTKPFTKEVQDLFKEQKEKEPALYKAVYGKG